MRVRMAVLLLVVVCAPVTALAEGDGADARLVHEGVVAAPVREVWAAFTTKKGQESWMVAHAEVDLRVGGLMRTHYDPKGALGDPGTIENTIISFDPERMLSIRVTKAPEKFPFPVAVKSMWTVIYFDAAGPQATRVRIVGLGFGGDEESKRMRAFFDRGNAYTLRKLQERFGAAAQRAFFENLKRLCGRRFEGETVFPPDKTHPLAGKRLVMSVESCGEKEIRIPFVVGEDRSRTWVLTLTDAGLLFKHDHRHPDGTPDRVTMYGGLAAPDGTQYAQSFPADAATAALIPDAATNVWTLQIDPDKQQFTYYLERHKEARYKALFKLKASPE